MPPSTHTTNLPPEVLAQAGAIVARYPEKRSATLPLLHLVQETQGWISEDIITWVASLVETSAMEVFGVLTFYPMFRQQPAGKRHVRVCRTLSCALRGACETMDALEKEFGVKHGETTADGNITLEYVECIASCGSGPVVQVDHTLHENITLERVPQLVQEIRVSLKSPNYGHTPATPGTPEWNG